MDQTLKCSDLKGKTVIVVGDGSIHEEIELRKKLAAITNQEVVMVTPEQTKEFNRGVDFSDLHDLHNNQLNELSNELKLLDKQLILPNNDGKTSRRQRRENHRRLLKGKKPIKFK